MTSHSPLKVAIVHDWLTGFRGGELVLEAIAELYPNADLFTLIFADDQATAELPASILKLPRKVSFLNRLPHAAERYRHFLPLMPFAIRRFDLSAYDLVLSSSHCVAKGVRKRPDALHVSYIHAPMRYMWDRFDDYFGPGRASLWVRFAARLLRPIFRAWDRKTATANRIDALIVNSAFIGEQVRSAYGRESEVIYPFADVERFMAPRKPEDFYLIFGAFAPYKRVDLAIEAFNRMGKPLWIAGAGQDEDRLKRLAGPNIRFLGRVDDREAADLFSRCRSLVFPGKEDFGIVPVEAMAAGAPVIAFGEGGAAETVTPQTGVFFQDQSVDALIRAVTRFESLDASRWESACRERARGFSRTAFQKKFLDAVERAWQNRKR